MESKYVKFLRAGDLLKVNLVVFMHDGRTIVQFLEFMPMLSRGACARLRVRSVSDGTIYQFPPTHVKLLPSTFLQIKARMDGTKTT